MLDCRWRSQLAVPSLIRVLEGPSQPLSRPLHVLVRGPLGHVRISTENGRHEPLVCLRGGMLQYDPRPGTRA